MIKKPFQLQPSWLLRLRTNSEYGYHSDRRQNHSAVRKTWNIEVFFQTCKSVLTLPKECRSLSYDAMSPQTACYGFFESLPTEVKQFLNFSGVKGISAPKMGCVV